MADVVTIKTFGEKLNSGAYSNGTAARRAVGRFQGWDDATRTKAHKLIDAKFGAAEKDAPKAKVKVAAPKVSAKPADKKATTKAPAKAPAKAAAAPKAPRAKAPARPKAQAGMGDNAAPCLVNPVFMASHCINTAAVAVDSAVKIKGNAPKVGVDRIFETAASIQVSALEQIQSVFGSQVVSLEKVVRPAAQVNITSEQSTEEEPEESPETPSLPTPGVSTL